MNNKEKQILIGSILGDGHVTKGGEFITGSKYLEWVEYKMNILKNYNITYAFLPKNGYSQTPYHKFYSTCYQDFKELNNLSLESKLSLLDELGLAVWLYDDGSLHKKWLFYNLNTHSFSHSQHENVIIPYLKTRWNINAAIYYDRKLDGRIFSYVYIPKKYGAQIINNILKKLPIQCYKYKTFEGNINDTIKVPCVSILDTINNTNIIVDNMTEASKRLGKSIFVTKESIKKRKLIHDRYLVELYYYN